MSQQTGTPMNNSSSFPSTATSPFHTNFHNNNTNTDINNNNNNSHPSTANTTSTGSMTIPMNNTTNFSNLSNGNNSIPSNFYNGSNINNYNNNYQQIIAAQLAAQQPQQQPQQNFLLQQTAQQQNQLHVPFLQQPHPSQQQQQQYQLNSHVFFNNNNNNNSNHNSNNNTSTNLAGSTGVGTNLTSSTLNTPTANNSNVTLNNNLDFSSLGTGNGPYFTGNQNSSIDPSKLSNVLRTLPNITQNPQIYQAILQFQQSQSQLQQQQQQQQQQGFVNNNNNNTTNLTSNNGSGNNSNLTSNVNNIPSNNAGNLYPLSHNISSSNTSTPSPFSNTTPTSDSNIATRSSPISNQFIPQQQYQQQIHQFNNTLMNKLKPQQFLMLQKFVAQQQQQNNMGNIGNLFGVNNQGIAVATPYFPVNSFSNSAVNVVANSFNTNNNSNNNTSSSSNNNSNNINPMDSRIISGSNQHQTLQTNQTSQYAPRVSATSINGPSNSFFLQQKTSAPLSHSQTQSATPNTTSLPSSSPNLLHQSTSVTGNIPLVFINHDATNENRSVNTVTPTFYNNTNIINTTITTNATTTNTTTAATSANNYISTNTTNGSVFTGGANQISKLPISNVQEKERQKAINPDYKAPFTNATDVYERLIVYRVFYGQDRNIEADKWAQKVETASLRYTSQFNANFDQKYRDVISQNSGGKLSKEEQLFIDNILHKDEVESWEKEKELRQEEQMSSIIDDVLPTDPDEFLAPSYDDDNIFGDTDTI